MHACDAVGIIHKYTVTTISSEITGGKSQSLKQIYRISRCMEITVLGSIFLASPTASLLVGPSQYACMCHHSARRRRTVRICPMGCCNACHQPTMSFAAKAVSTCCEYVSVSRSGCTPRTPVEQPCAGRGPPLCCRAVRK